MTEICYTFEDPVVQKHLRKAQKILSDGGIIAYPTDVNWACGCLVHHKKALMKLQQLNPLKSKKSPYSFIFSNLSQVSSYAAVDNNIYRFLKKILPGPYTVILNSHRRLPKIIEDKRKELGIRIPSRPLLLELTALLEVPLATVSLTLPDPCLQDKRPRHGYEIAEAYSSLIDLILDLSFEINYQETTLLRFTDHIPKLIRSGSQKLDPWLSNHLEHSL